MLDATTTGLDTTTAGLDITTRVARHPRVVFRPLGADNGGVVLHLGTAAYHGVNEIGALVFSLLDGTPTVGEIVEDVRGRLDDPPPDLESDLTEFLAGLAARDLILVGADAGTVAP